MIVGIFDPLDHQLEDHGPMHVHGQIYTSKFKQPPFFWGQSPYDLVKTSFMDAPLPLASSTSVSVVDVEIVRGFVSVSHPVAVAGRFVAVVRIVEVDLVRVEHILLIPVL